MTSEREEGKKEDYQRTIIGVSLFPQKLLGIVRLRYKFKYNCFIFVNIKLFEKIVIDSLINY